MIWRVSVTKKLYTEWSILFLYKSLNLTISFNVIRLSKARSSMQNMQGQYSQDMYEQHRSLSRKTNGEKPYYNRIRYFG